MMFDGWGNHEQIHNFGIYRKNENFENRALLCFKLVQSEPRAKHFMKLWLLETEEIVKKW